MQDADARTMLQDQLDQCLAADARSRGRYEGDMANDPPDRSVDPIDQAADASQAHEMDALGDNNARREKALRQALDRLDNGTYGVCERCGNTIPDERLEARPESRYCLSCQRTMEAAANDAI